MRIKRISALLLAMIMIFTCMTGCGKTSEDSNTGSINGIDGAFSENGVDGSDSQQADGNIAMGRYVEEVTDFYERVS